MTNQTQYSPAVATHKPPFIHNDIHGLFSPIHLPVYTHTQHTAMTNTLPLSSYHSSSFLLLGLCLHLLYLHSIQPSSPHEQVMVAHAQLHNLAQWDRQLYDNSTVIIYQLSVKPGLCVHSLAARLPSPEVGMSVNGL